MDRTGKVGQIVAFSLFLSSPQILAQAPSPGTAGHAAAKKSAVSPSVALTAQEKEAQKHYRIALEALKQNDSATALQELNAAAELAPKNAVIWYNLAVLESKNGYSKLALEHLQKSNSLGLPKTLRDDADQLEAKLSYEAEKDNKIKAEEVKRKESEDKQKELDGKLDFIFKSIGSSDIETQCGKNLNDKNGGTKALLSG